MSCVSMRKLFDKEIVAGLNLTNIKPWVWDDFSDYYLPQLSAIMVSYAEFHQSLNRRECSGGWVTCQLGIPKQVRIYLNNGTFRFSQAKYEVSRDDYEEFVKSTQPYWCAIPQDYIPARA